MTMLVGMDKKKYSIFRSRQGYAYQDKYALFIFLKRFKEGRVTEFYVDFPFGENGYSLDFLIVCENPRSKHIFEVKTGEKFKDSKYKELSKELKYLYEYGSGNAYVDTINLIIDPEIKVNIERNLTDLRAIKQCSRGTYGKETYNDLLKRCYEGLGNFIATEEEFKSFVRKIKFNDEPLSNSKSEHNPYSNLERLLTEEVHEMTASLDMQGCGEELPYWLTVESLLEVVKEYAGSGENLVPRLKNVLAEWAGRRSILRHLIAKSAISSTIVDINGATKEAKAKMDEKYKKYSSDIISTCPDILRINDVIEKKMYIDNKANILFWLQDEKLGNYFLNKLPKKFENLKEIDFLLEKLIKAQNPFFVLGILEKSISEKNNGYIFEFLNNYIEELVKKDSDTFGNYAVEIIRDITEKFPGESQKAFGFVKEFIKAYPEVFADLRSTREHGKQAISEVIFNIFQIWKEERRGEKIEKLIELISKNFNLIDDDYKFSMFTPETIFSVLYEYVILDFEKNFPKVVRIIAGQFKDKRVGYGKEWDGKDWSGSGISQSGNSYLITDKHFVERSLALSAKYFYENTKDKEVAWKKLKELCVVSKKEISTEKPEFLNRAILPIVLERYEKCEDDVKKEPLGILKDFLEMTTLPDKNHLIFQYVAHSQMDASNKWKLVQASLDVKWNKKKLPTNVFVEQIVSELAEDGRFHSKATELLEQWSENETYLERQNFGEHNFLGIFSKLLSSEKKEVKREGVKLFEKYIYSNAFKNKLERFDSFDVADKIALILDFDFKKGIEILNKVYKQEDLSENEQILICSGINKVSNPETRIKVYDAFLKNILCDLGNNIERIVGKFSTDYPRTAIVEFGDELAKEKKFAEALEIAKIFINDPDPRIGDKDDNLHERIKKGEEESSISSVRGWVCWLLQQFSVLEGREYIPEIIPLIEKLSRDENYYVRSQACFPLAELMRIRNTVMPENREEFFMSRDDAGKIEGISFEMLRRKENHTLKAVMANLAHVFDYMRSMNTEQALEVLTTFKNLKFTEPLERLAALYLFYAEFRKDAFKEGVMKDYVKEFDDSGMRKMLEEYLESGNESGKLALLQNIIGLVSESEKNIRFSYEQAFDIAYKYVKIAVGKYNPSSYLQVYRFIEENLERKYEDGKDLFLICILKEKEYLKGNTLDVTWMPTYHHIKILDKMMSRDDKDGYLQSMKIISEYPQEYFSWRKFYDAASHLAEFSKDNEAVKKIFDNMVDKNPMFYDIKIKQGGKEET